jgi:hypothetical protein
MLGLEILKQYFERKPSGQDNKTNLEELKGLQA